MMRRAGTPPDHMAKLISKSYCSAYCLEGQISVDLGPGATRPRSGFLETDEPRVPERALTKG